MKTFVGLSRWKLAATVAATLAVGGGRAAAAAHEASGTSGGGAISTVFVIVMENHDWSAFYQSASAPYINNTLLPQSSYCSNYQGTPIDVHPSEPNYLWLEAGDNFGIHWDHVVAPDLQTTTDHLSAYLDSAGISWREYAEGANGTSCPLDYSVIDVNHVPFVYFADVVGNPPSASNPNCIAHIRPYTELAGDLQSGTVAQYNFITPDLCDDGHDSCAPQYDPVRQTDDWLSVQIPMIMASQAYQNNGAIFITWDESQSGRVPIGMIVLSPKARGGGYVSDTRYYHSSTLRTMQEIFGVMPLLRDAANQPNLSDLFTSFP